MSGNPQVEDAYNQIDRSKAQAAGESDCRVVNKAPESSGGVDCGAFSLWITDGNWQLCFEPTQ